MSLASLVQAVSNYVTAPVEGHVTRGLESAASDVLQAFMEINVSWVRQKAALIHCAPNYTCVKANVPISKEESKCKEHSQIYFRCNFMKSLFQTSGHTSMRSLFFTFQIFKTQNCYDVPQQS